MKLEERVAEATNDKKLKNDLIGEYQNFILAAASKVLKRSVTTSDDEYIIAMVAFGDAIDGYNENKGNFLSFAKTVIRNRIIDSIRREAKHNSVPFSALEKENSDGETFKICHCTLAYFDADAFHHIRTFAFSFYGVKFDE